MKIFVRVKLSKLLKIFIIVFISSFINAEELKLTRSDKINLTDSRALEKSLIFPGLGQLHEKKYLKGVIFITAELIAITGAILNNRHGNINYNKYRSSLTESDALFFREETEKFDRSRNLFIAAGIGVWMINMLDIYILKKRMGKKPIKVSLQKGINNEISFTLNYSF